MNLSEPLEGLLSQAAAAVLRVLARADTAFSGRQIHSLAGTSSVAGINRALNALIDLGLVMAEPRPPSILYRINREHALWPAVELGLSARQRVFESTAEFCASELPEGLDLSVVVYGSVARHESDAKSDVDLLVVYPDGIDPEFRADYNYQIAVHVERITGNAAQVFSLERADLAQRIAENDPFIVNVLEDGIHIYGTSLRSGRKRAS